MKVAIVVDGLDATRQFHSDSGAAIEDASKRALENFPNFSCQIYRDDQISDLLENLQYPRIAAVIFASNSLRHPEGKIVQILKSQQSRNRMSNFLESGGGLAILHQFTDLPLPDIFPDNRKINFSRRESVKVTLPFSVAPETLASDPLLNFPFSIQDEGYNLAEQGQLSEVISWMKISDSTKDLDWLEPTLKSVTGDLLIAKSPDGFPWRLVISTIPLDWHRATPLLANIIRYVATGKPQIAIWPPKGKMSTPAMVSNLAGSPTSFLSDSEPTNSRLHNWIFRLPILHLFTGLHITLESDQESSILDNGGLIMQVTTDPLTSESTFIGKVGTRRREIFTRFFRTYSASWSGAPNTTDPFPLRNVVVASSYFVNHADSSGVLWNPQQDLKFQRGLEELIKENMTVTTASALLQIFASSKASKENLHRVHSVLYSHETNSIEEIFLQRVASVVIGESTFEDFMNIVSNLLESQREVHAELAIRIIDWIGFIHFELELECNFENPPYAVFEKLIDAAHMSEFDGVWLSIEGTTSAVMGICALSQILNQPNLLSKITLGVTALRSHSQNSAANIDSVAIDLRVLQTLFILEGFSPSILEQIENSLKFVSSEFQSSLDALNSMREKQTSTQIALKNRKLNGQLEGIRKQYYIYLLGAISLWILSIGTLIAVAGIIVLIGFIKVAWIALIVAPLGFGWLYLAFFILNMLEDLLILPKWLAKGKRKFSKFNKWFPEFRGP